jgi:hypothetical protein
LADIVPPIRQYPNETKEAATSLLPRSANYPRPRRVRLLMMETQISREEDAMPLDITET